MKFLILSAVFSIVAKQTCAHEMKFLILSAVFSIVAKQTCALSIECIKSLDGNSMTAVFREVVSSSVSQIQGVDATNGATLGCTSTVVTSGGVTAHELRITVSLTTQMQTDPILTQSNCYVIAPTAPATTYTYNVVSKKNANMIQINDILSTAGCDSAAATTPRDEVTGGVAVVNVLTAVAASVVSDDIAAGLYDASETLVTAPDLGEQVRLRVTFTLATGIAAGTFPEGLQIFDVELSGYSDFRTVYNLYTSNGCINETAQSELGTTAGITYNAGLSTADTTHIFDTGLFQAAIFDGPVPKKMYIRFSFNKTCYDPTDIRCGDHQQYCTNNALTRKKRSVDHVLTSGEHFVQNIRVKRNANTRTNGTLSFSVPINVNKKGATDAIGGSGNNGGDSSVTKENRCDVPDMYWIIAVVLGVLLLCMMAFCVFLVLRLRKQQNVARHVSEKLGHQNSGYRY